MARGDKKISERGVNTRFNGETAAKAARKSVEARKQRKLEQNVAELFAAAMPPMGSAREYCAKFGLDPNDPRTAFEIAFAKSIVQPAMGGDREAFMKWAEMLGQDGNAVRDKMRYAFEREKMMIARNGLGGGQAEDDGFMDAIRAGCAEAWALADDPLRPDDKT